MQKKSKIKKVAGFLLWVCLLMLQTTHAEDKKSLCQVVFDPENVDVINTSNQIAGQQLKEDFSSKRDNSSESVEDYISGSVLDQNNAISIRQALSVSRGYGAAIVNVNTFTPELAEKIRLAIHEALSDPKNNYADRNGLPGLGFFGSLYEEDWTEFKIWLLEKQRKVFSTEIDRFRHQVDEYLYQVKDLIFRTDRQNIKLKFFVIRTDKILYFIDAHRHIEPEYDTVYLTTSIAPVGLGTYYEKWVDGKQQRVLPHWGNTVIMSDKARMKTFSEEDYTPVFHGTPHGLEKRLIILSVFEKSD